MTPIDLRDLLLGLGNVGLSGGCCWFLKRLSKKWDCAQEEQVQEKEQKNHASPVGHR
jgi:hypothetical protein